MLPTKEAWEKWDKFIPWLNEKPRTSWEEAGLRADAPEEAQKAYAEYRAEKEERRKRGLL
jgi:hypothetical protein